MSLTRDDFLTVKALIEENQSFLIAVHVRPDPDAIGSALALARGLRFLGKDVTVISQDGIPDICEYLPDVDTVMTGIDTTNADVGIICDASDITRIGDNVREAFYNCRKLIVIDHHVTASASGAEGSPVVLADTSAAATAEIVFELLHKLDVVFDMQTAVLLMAGLVGDTGGFRFTNVTSNTLEIASRLMDFGATPGEAARQIYENRTEKNMRLLGLALLNAVIEENGALIWSEITRKDFDRFNASDFDTDSIINQLQAVKGVMVAVLFRELQPDRIQVSFRSRGLIDVNRIAAAFEGGGHAAASGATIKKPLAEARQAVLDEVRRWMES